MIWVSHKQMPMDYFMGLGLPPQMHHPFQWTLKKFPYNHTHGPCQKKPPFLGGEGGLQLKSHLSPHLKNQLWMILSQNCVICIQCFGLWYALAFRDTGRAVLTQDYPKLLFNLNKEIYAIDFWAPKTWVFCKVRGCGCMEFSKFNEILGVNLGGQTPSRNSRFQILSVPVRTCFEHGWPWINDVIVQGVSELERESVYDR